MMGTVGISLMPFHHNGRMNAVEVEDSHVTDMLVVFITHQLCAIIPVVMGVV